MLKQELIVKWGDTSESIWNDSSVIWSVCTKRRTLKTGISKFYTREWTELQRGCWYAAFAKDFWKLWDWKIPWKG